MSEKKQGIYEFHNFQLDVGKGILFRENQPVTLQWKTFELLCTLVKSNGNLVTRDELIKFFDGKIAKWMMPDDVVFVDQLPHTATGKLLKTKLREEYKNYQLPG